ncbi:hypothetical protein OHA72_43655 [Dactylosporangium sp. NBC_01737]|nr:hypothetical protein OHA72_43655 [Dactylosporangium sp. NBC_01737]
MRIRLPPCLPLPVAGVLFTCLVDPGLYRFILIFSAVPGRAA